MGVFARIMMGWQSKAQIIRPSQSTPPTTRHILRRLGCGKKGGGGRLIGQTKGEINTKPHAVTEGNGRPVHFFITAGQVSDYTGAAALMNALPEADWLLADRGYDADWFREGYIDKGIRSCILGLEPSKTTIKYDKGRYKPRNRYIVVMSPRPR